MKAPTIKFVFDRKHVSDPSTSPNKKKKKGLIQAEVKYDGERRFYSTGIKVYRDQWSDSLMVINCPMLTSYNKVLNEMMRSALNNIDKQFASGTFSFNDFDLVFDLSRSDEATLVGEIRRLKDMSIDKDMTYSTIMGYEVVANRVEEFNACKRFARSKMRDIEKIRYEHIEDFDLWLRSEVHLSDNTVWTYHSHLRRVITNYINRNDSRMQNPYNVFKFKRPARVGVRYLTEEELDRIEEYSSDKYHLQFARDMFMFMRYTGLSYADATTLRMSEDVIIENGKYIIRRNRLKTGKQYTLVLLDPAREIWEKYDGNMDRYTISRMNIILHEVGMASIGKQITCHMARHSYAVWALHNNVKIENLSKMLGHTNIQTTQIYAKVLQQDVIDEFDKLDMAISRKKVSEEEDRAAKVRAKKRK